jgi:hypothetical protein
MIAERGCGGTAADGRAFLPTCGAAMLYSARQSAAPRAGRRRKSFLGE